MLANWPFQNHVNQVNIRWIKEIKGAKKEVRGSKVIFRVALISSNPEVSKKIPYMLAN